jgi:hypothetical protein
VIEAVVVEVESPPAEVAAVEEVFREAGFPVNVQAVIIRRSVGDLSWIIDITLVAGLGAFAVSFSSEAGKDSYAGFKLWIKRLIAARRGSGSLNFEDAEATQLIIPSGITDEALDALAEVDWSDTRGGYLLWDTDEGRWFDQMKRH